MSAMDSSVVVSGRNSAVPHYNPQSGGIQGRIYNPVGVGGGDNVAVRSSSTTSSSYSTDQPSLVQNQMNSSSSNVMNNTNTNSLNHASVSQQELLTNQFSAMAMAASGANSIRIKAAFNGNVYISSIEYNYSIEELVDHIQSICGIQSNNISESSSASSPSSTDATSGQNGKANVRNSLLSGNKDTSSACTIKWVDEDGDPCTLESEWELREAIRQYHENKDNEIKLYVFASKPNKPGEPCEGEVKDIYRRGARRWRRLYKINGHSFAAKRFGKRALCFICRDVIWGLGRQGFRCVECKIMVHKKCHKRVSFVCGESYDTITRSLPTQKRETEDRAELDAALYNNSMARTSNRQQNNNNNHQSSYPHTVSHSHHSSNQNSNASSPSKKAQNQADHRQDTAGSPGSRNQKQQPRNHHHSLSSDVNKINPRGVPTATSASDHKATPHTFVISLADFNLLKVIGRGSFAKVLLAEYKKTGKKYAMKVIKKESIHDDEDIDCVQTEKNVFEIATNHPFLVGLHSCFQTPSRLIFVIEFVSGGDLMYHMQRQKKLPEEHGRFYAAEICSALHYLHDKGIIYRDLKLDNVLLDDEGHVKLTDYGMCKENMGYYDTTGTFCGTPNYIAPELLTGAEYGFSVDWWALGVLTYEMLAGRSPFDLLNVDNVQNTEEYLFQIILEKPIRIPRSLSPKASAVLKGFLNKNPADRLGCDPAEGYTHIQNHPFFRTVDWEKLERKQIEPPFKPTLEDEHDLNNFDPQFTDEPVQFTPDTAAGNTDTIDQSEFEGFDYVNPLLMSSEDNV